MDTSHWNAPGAIDAQEACPLYATIPTELREQIFEYVLQEEVSPGAFTSHDFCVRQDHDLAPGDDSDIEYKPDAPSYLSTSNYDYATRNWTMFYSRSVNTDPEDRVLGVWSSHCLQHAREWARHDVTGPIKPMPPILALCRRIYLEITEGHCESFKQLWRRREYRMFLKDCAPNLQFRTDRWVRPTRAHLYIKLDQGRFPLISELRDNLVLSHVRDLRITIPRRGWPWYPRLQPLYIDPFAPNTPSASEYAIFQALCGDLEPMEVFQARSLQRSKNMDDLPSHLQWVRLHPSMRKDTGAMAFRGLASLQTLTLTFETAEWQASELADIVKWSLNWRFPLQSAVDTGTALRYLEADPASVRLSSWRGLNYETTWQCPRCQYAIVIINGSKLNNIYGTGVHHQCDECDRIERLARRGYGPRIHAWTVEWTAKTDEDLEFVPMPAAGKHSYGFHVKGSGYPPSGGQYQRELVAGEVSYDGVADLFNEDM